MTTTEILKRTAALDAAIERRKAQVADVELTRRLLELHLQELDRQTAEVKRLQAQRS